MNVSIIYWSGTGNTKMMAEAISEGMQKKGAMVKLTSVSEATLLDALNCNLLILGCPSMGCEILEESEMEPYVAQLVQQQSLKNKPLALFGSYDWGDGQWMKEWEERMVKAGFCLLCKGLTVQTTPDEESLKLCKNFGETLTANPSE